MSIGKKNLLVAFQGLSGAYSDLAAREVFPGADTMPCPSFEDALKVVEKGIASKAIIPVENTIAGRVAEIHQILSSTKLQIVAEHFHRVNHHLLVVKGAKVRDLRSIYSHIHALNQCRKFTKNMKVNTIFSADTAGAAKDVSMLQDKTNGAIASALAAKIYNLSVIRSNIEDVKNNVTRFLVLGSDEANLTSKKKAILTSLVFYVRNVPAAMHKALGGFATNNVNMTKLESFMAHGSFRQAQFYADIEGHPDEKNVKLALEELSFFSKKVKILGSYYAHPYRKLHR
jgi:prephenate dehydratase|tara:strand:+ start:2001 stop:2858 length:858 start_codon:yes stop_codon:yes gene_type:complete